MPGSRWTNEEIAVIVYFRSRGISIVHCKDLLELKLPFQQHRTLDGVTLKLQVLSRDHQLSDQHTKQWFIDASDNYINSLGLSNLSELTQVGLQERGIIGDVKLAAVAAYSILICVDANTTP